jgi:hypothetical protein
MFREAKGFVREAFTAPFGLFSSTRQIAQAAGGVLAPWSERGWADCSGIQCTESGCFAADNKLLLRVQAPLGYADYCYAGPQCQRQVWRDWAEYALSRFTQPHRFDVSGATSIETASRLPTNPWKNDNLLDLPAESFSIQYSDKHPRTVTNDYEAAVYTKGLLP